MYTQQRQSASESVDGLRHHKFAAATCAFAPTLAALALALALAATLAGAAAAMRFVVCRPP